MGCRSLILSVILVFSVQPFLQAQNLSDEKYQKSNFFSPDKEEVFFGGFTVGGNFSTVDGDSYGGYKKVGLVGGATVYVRLMPKVLANVELLYTMKGSRGVVQKTSYYTGEFFERYWLDLNYVEVPVMFHYEFTSRWHLGFGAAYARLVGTPREEIYTDQPVTIDPLTTSFNDDDINFLIGGSLQIGNGWFLTGRYQRSVKSIRQAQNIPFWQYSTRQLNDLFSLRLTYLID